MRIVVDVAPLSHPRTGVGNYIRGSLLGLAQAGADDLVAFAPASRSGRREIESSLDGVTAERRLPVLPAAHALRTAWSRLGAPPLETVVGAFDVFHFSDWMYPPQRGGIRSTMIHDLVPVHFPNWVHRRTERMHGAKYGHAARACDVIVVNSRFTADDVAETLAVDRERIHVAYPGVDPRFSPDGGRAEGEYLLAVGTLEPRKNLANAIAAADRLGVELRVVGARGWGGVEAEGRNVTWLGYPADAELPVLYRGAAAFVYPSRFEGFGIPVLEAMACGTPCVVSSHPSLDEAAGDAAVRADPDDVEAIAAGVERARNESGDLVRRGLERARRFTWLENGRVHLAAWEGSAMKVAVDVTPLDLTRAGTARYLHSLLPRVEREVTIERLRSYSAGRAGTLWLDLAWYPHVLPHRARGADVLHCPTYRGPVRSRVPLVVTVHDLAVFRHPEAFPPWTRNYSRVVVPRVVKAARIVAAVSEFTARELETLLHVPRERIRVVPNAAADTFSEAGPREEGDYVLAVGTLEPRKNLARTIEAAQRLGVELRVAGARGWGGVEALGPGVRWEGEIGDEQLARLYRGALCVAYPSLYEGFGIPVLEAMACGAPVVTSRIGATAEVAGGAAVLVDPEDVSSIAAGIEDAIARRVELRAAGLRRAGAYSWDESARLLVQAYEAAA